MKRPYHKPLILTIQLQGLTLMLGGSYNVSGYSKGSDISIGDSDDPSAARGGSGPSEWDD